MLAHAIQGTITVSVSVVFEQGMFALLNKVRLDSVLWSYKHCNDKNQLLNISVM